MKTILVGFVFQLHHLLIKNGIYRILLLSGKTFASKIN